ncbi:MAG TPA: crotonase/enoyl-CoA hydratase family protein [Pseudonocardiaceae bacterium]
MTTPAVQVHRSGPVTTVVLSRPARRNAVDGATAAELADAFRAFDADDEAAVAVLHGDGGVFCAGADLTAVGTERGNRVDPDGDGPMGPTRMRLSKPVIAAVAGHAVAGGLELALWCDLRVADETAVFGVFCRRWGVPLIDGGTVRLPRLIGTSRAGRRVHPRQPCAGQRGTARRRPVRRGRGPARRLRHPRAAGSDVTDELFHRRDQRLRCTHAHRPLATPAVPAGGVRRGSVPDRPDQVGARQVTRDLPQGFR